MKETLTKFIQQLETLKLAVDSYEDSQNAAVLDTIDAQVVAIADGQLELVETLFSWRQQQS